MSMLLPTPLWRPPEFEMSIDNSALYLDGDMVNKLNYCCQVLLELGYEVVVYDDHARWRKVIRAKLPVKSSEAHELDCSNSALENVKLSR